MSRGMASKEEMIPVNGDVDLTCDGLTEEMKTCEDSAASNEWQAPLEEVFTLPDVSRTSFLWQVALEDEEDWELGEEEKWRCMPSHWQSILNNRLADFQSRVQDCEALWRHRLEEYGEDDIKTKNAKSKFEAFRSGEGADSIILICKSTGKEASSDVYSRSVNKTKGVCRVTTSARVQAFRLNVKDMTLEELSEEEQQNTMKRLRIVSVTGRSRQIQELRVHLSSLSLCTSHVMDGMDSKLTKNKKSDHKKDGQGQL